MADRSVREYSTQAPAPYVGDFLQKGIFPYANQFLQGQFANMGTPDSNPYTYTGQRVAGFDPRERYAMNLSDSAIGSYRPYLQRQSNLLNQADRYLNLGTSAGAGLTGESANRFRTLPAAYDPTSYSAYMNPYTDEVINRSLQDIRDQTEKNKMVSRDSSVDAGAFGGSRGRLTEADIERAGLREMGVLSSDLRAKGFAASQEAAYKDYARQQAERGAAATGLGGLGEQYSGMGSTAAQGLANLGTNYGGMATSLPTLQGADINRTMGMGGLGRGRQQSLMDLGYQNFVGQYNLPMQTLSNVGSLTASLGPMAGGYGYAGSDQNVALSGLNQFQPDPIGKIGAPPDNSRFAYQAPTPPLLPNNYGHDPNAIAANPQGYQNYLQRAGTQETNMPGSTFLGQPQSSLGGNTPAGGYSPVASNNATIPTYGGNVPVAGNQGLASLV